MRPTLSKPGIAALYAKHAEAEAEAVHHHTGVTSQTGTNLRICV